MRQKICSDCGEFGEFYEDKNSADGLMSYCKNCSSKRCKEYYKEHKQELDKEKRREAVKRWRANNPERYKELMLNNNRKRNKKCNKNHENADTTITGAAG